MSALRSCRPSWLILAAALSVLGHLARVRRWTYAVRAVRETSYRPIFAAAQIGFLLNITLPLRTGEAGRALILARGTGLRKSQAVVLVAIDRVADLLGLLPILFITMATFPVHRVTTLSAESVGNTAPLTVSPAIIQGLTMSALVVLSLAAVTFLLAYFRITTLHTIIDLAFRRRWPHLATRLRTVADGFYEGTRVFRSTSRIVATLVFSLAGWVCGILSLAATVRAFGVSCPWYLPFLMQTMIVACVATPVVPGLVGQYHLGVVGSLLLSTSPVSGPTATAVAIVSHLLSIGVVVGMALIGFAFDRAAHPDAQVSNTDKRGSSSDGKA